MTNFWDSNVWGGFMMVAVLLLSLLVANALKRRIRFLGASLIPTSVLGGLILLIISGIYKLCTGELIFNSELFGGNGMDTMEVITYHALALGFIASTFKASKGKLTKKRTGEIFDTGVTTVATYLLQAVFGLAVTLIAAKLASDLFAASGIILPFGYGQGPGQAMNYGSIYETEHGFVGGKSFGLTIAALGFLSASLGGVVHLNILKKKGKIASFGAAEGTADALRSEDVQETGEIPMQGSMDKLTVQLAVVASAYVLTYILMFLLGLVLPGMKSTIYGFNFLLGVLSATLIKTIVNFLRKKNVIRRQYINDFLMTRVSNFFFDLMVVASIAAIRLGIFQKYWGVIIILGVGGLLLTYFYNHYIAKKFFPEYQEEQFLTMYGMLTGTASTGIILLREIDGDFKTPAADNLVYQNFPAIAFGFPLMLLATLAPVKPVLTFIILVVFFLVMNIILFRRQIFRKKK